MKQIVIKTVTLFTIGCASILTACTQESATTAKLTAQELNTTSIGGTATEESLLGLKCEITDPPLVQTVMLGLNLRQNMELKQVQGTDEVVGLEMGNQNNVVIIFNNVVNQSRQTFVGGDSDQAVNVSVSIDENGGNKYSLKFQDESILEIIKNIDVDGNVSYSKTGSTASVNCSDFATLEDILTKINTNPMVDPNIQGPQ